MSKHDSSNKNIQLTLYWIKIPTEVSKQDTFHILSACYSRILNNAATKVVLILVPNISGFCSFSIKREAQVSDTETLSMCNTYNSAFTLRRWSVPTILCELYK